MLGYSAVTMELLLYYVSVFILCSCLTCESSESDAICVNCIRTCHRGHHIQFVRHDRYTCGSVEGKGRGRGGGREMEGERGRKMKIEGGWGDRGGKKGGRGGIEGGGR